MNPSQEIAQTIYSSPLISRDLSWLRFNHRVLEQAKNTDRTILERLKFLAITSSNLDEFLMIRVGSLYNYLDYGKSRVDYCGLREEPFKVKLFEEIHKFINEQRDCYDNQLQPLMSKSGFDILNYNDVPEKNKKNLNLEFSKAIFPILTPMVYDSFHVFPVLLTKLITFGVVTRGTTKEEKLKYSFIQVPNNLPRFYEIDIDGKLVFVTIESIIEANIHKLYKNIEIVSVNLFRLSRNGDFDYDDYDEGEVDFVEEIQNKLQQRKTGRVVRMEMRTGFAKNLNDKLLKIFNIEPVNQFEVKNLLDLSSLWAIIGNKQLAHLLPDLPEPVKPLFSDQLKERGFFNFLKKQDVVLHHPYNSMDTVVKMLEEAAHDPKVLAIKITIYRLAKNSRVATALLHAAENGKHVSVLFEVKARFDEENNIAQGKILQKAGCFVIYGLEKVKTHTKLMMIVRQEKNDVTRYVHMSSGNYNEDTARFYTDTSLLSARRVYGNDVSEFFNVITGHSLPPLYRKLITTPGDMRKKLIFLIRKEASNARKGVKSAVIIKVNSLEDKFIIEELYKASKAGVKVKLIVRGICCIRPRRKGLSENISVKSIVGDFLEHSRIYYFHNAGDPKVFGGSADIMVRSFEKRIESLFLTEGTAEKQMMSILDYSLRDTINSFEMLENGEFKKVTPKVGVKPFNCHKEFYNLTEEEVQNVKLI